MAKFLNQCILGEDRLIRIPRLNSVPNWGDAIVEGRSISANSRGTEVRTPSPGGHLIGGHGYITQQARNRTSETKIASTKSRRHKWRPSKEKLVSPSAEE